MESANAHIKTQETTTAAMLRDLAFINGKYLEMGLQCKIHGILGVMRLSRVRIARATYPAAALPSFCDKMYDSLEEGAITDDQYMSVMDADLIAKARRRGVAEWVYIAVETSYRLNREDADRAEAAKRALETIFPQSEVRAMVYGAAISDADRLHAESKGVEVLLEQRY